VDGAILLTHGSVGDIYLLNDRQTGVLDSVSSEEPSLNPPPRLDESDPGKNGKKGVTREIIRTREPVMIPEMKNDARVQTALVERGFKSMIGVPMKIEGSVVGVLYVCDKESHEFSETEKSFLNVLTTQGALAIKKSRLRVEMENSKNRYKSLVQSIPLYLFSKGLDLRFTFVNKKFLESTGKRMDEVLGHTDREIYSAEDAARYQEMDLKVIESRKPLDFEEDHVIPATQEKIRVKCIKTPILNAKSEVVEIQGVFWNITPEKEAQKLEREVRNRYESLVEQSPFGVIVHKHGQINLANTAAAKILNFKSREEILKYNILDLIHEEDRRLASERLEQMLKDETVRPGIKMKMINPASPEKSVLVKVYSRNSKNPEEIQVIIRDLSITELA
jgi:PAS domain S-box-containing protein